MKRVYFVIVALFFGLTIVGCGGHDHAGHDHAHDHEDNLQLTEYLEQQGDLIAEEVVQYLLSKSINDANNPAIAITPIGISLITVAEI